MTQPTVSANSALSVELAPLKVSHKRSLFLNHTQISRLVDLGQYQLELRVSEDSKDHLPSISKLFDDLAPCLAQIFPADKVYLIGGAASWVIAGNGVYGDLDFCVEIDACQDEKFELLKDRLICLVQTWLPGRGRRFWHIDPRQKIWESYFYKSNTAHLTLSLGNLDIKILRKGCRSNLFDHDSIGIRICWEDLARSKIETIPGAVHKDFDSSLDAVFHKKLILTRPDSAHNFHFRVFQKFSEGFIVEYALIQRSLVEIKLSFQINPRFFELFRFFCQNHLSVENGRVYQLNLLNALSVSEQIPLELKNPLRLGIEKVLDEHMGQVAQEAFWDPYQELLSLVTGLFFTRSKDLKVFGHHLQIEKKHYFLPKVLSDCLLDAVTTLPLDPFSCFDILQNWFWMSPEPCLSREMILDDLCRRFFPAIITKSQNHQEMSRKIHQFLAPLNARRFAIEDPLGFLFDAWEKRGLTRDIFVEVFPKVIAKRNYKPDKIIEFLSFFDVHDFLDQKRLFFRSYYLNPEKRIDFFKLVEIFSKLYGSEALSEMLSMYPLSFFSTASNWIEDDAVYVENKLFFLDWIKQNDLLKHLSYKAQDRIQIVNLSLNIEKAKALFIKKEYSQKLISWLSFAYENHPQAFEYFNQLHSLTVSLEEKSLFYKLILVLHQRTPSSPLPVQEINASDPVLFRSAKAFLKIAYGPCEIAPLEAVSILSFIPSSDLRVLEESIIEIFCQGLEKNLPGLIELSVFLCFEKELKSFLNFIEEKIPLVYRERAIYCLLNELKLPHPKTGDYALSVSRFFNLAPSLYVHPKRVELLDNWVKTLNEKQLLPLLGILADRFKNEVLWSKSLKTGFSGSVLLKEQYVFACLYFLKTDPSRLSDLDAIFCLLTEVVGVNGFQSDYFPLFLEFGSSELDYYKRTLELILTAKSKEKDLELFTFNLIEKARGLKLPFAVVEKLKKKFSSPKLFEMLEMNCDGLELCEGIAILKKEGVSLLNKSPRITLSILKALEKQPRLEDLEELIAIIQTTALVDEPFLFSLIEVCILSQNPKSIKFSALLLSWIQSLISSNADSFEKKVLNRPVIEGYLEENIGKITNIELRSRIFKNLFEKESFLITRQTLPLLESFFGKKNIDTFFHQFLDPKTFEKLVHFCMNDPELCRVGAKWLYLILTASTSVPAIHPQIINATLSRVLDDKLIEQFSLVERIDLAMLIERNGKSFDFERIILQNFDGDLGLLKSSRIGWLVSEMKLLGIKSERASYSSMKLLIHIIHKKEMCDWSLDLMDLMKDGLPLNKSDFSLLTNFILEKDLDQPDLVAKCIELFECYEGTLFFPGQIFQDDLAFLYLLSQGEADEVSFEKMERCLPVYAEFSQLHNIQNITRITKKIVSHLTYSTPTAKFQVVKHYFANFYKILSKQKFYETAWLRLHLIGNSIARKKDGLEVGFDEIISGLSPKEIIDLIRLRMFQIRERLVESTVEIYHLEHIRATVAYAIESGVGNIFKKGELEAFLKSKSIENSQEDIDFYNKYRGAIEAKQEYEFFLDNAFKDLSCAIRTLRHFFDKGDSLEKKKELASEISQALEIYTLTTQFGLNIAQVDLKLVNRIFRENLKDIGDDSLKAHALFVFKIYATLLSENQGFFCDRREELHLFLKGVLNPLILSGALSAESVLLEIFRFYDHAVKNKDHAIVNMAAETLVSVYDSKMGVEGRCLQKIALLELGELVKISYVSIIIGLLERYDEVSYHLADELNRQFKDIYEMEVPKIRNLLDDDRYLYNFGPETFDRALFGITHQVKVFKSEKLRIEFLRRLGGRLLFLTVSREGFCQDKFLWMINLFFEEQIRLLVQKNLEDEELLALVNLVNSFYPVFVQTLLEISDKLQLSDLTTRKLYSSILLIAIRKICELVVFYPKLRSPALPILFEQGFPLIKKMLDVQVKFMDKDKEASTLRTDVEIAFRSLLLNCKRVFHPHRVEQIAVTVLQYAYVGILEKEYKFAKLQEKKDCLKLDVMFFVLSLNLKDVADQVFTTPSEFSFLLDHFKLFLDFDPLATQIEKKQVLESFLPWIEDKFCSIKGFVQTEKMKENLYSIRKRLCDMAV